MSLTLGTLTLDGPAALAPMAGYTDAGFRVLCREQGCALGVSEMVSAEGLLRGGWATARLMRIVEEERPVAVQLYGHDPERMAEAAAVCEAEAAPDLIDLNMGCPVKKVVRRGAGVALMRDTARAVRMTAGVRAAVSCPVTAKIRAGWSADELNALAFAEAIQDAGADAITIHARTRAQVHSGEADWGLIGQLRERLRIPVLGNGGVRTAADAVDMLETTGVPALMVGRAAIGNPWLFREIRAALDGRTVAPPTADELRDVIGRHLDALIQANEELGLEGAEGRACAHFRGHLVKYTAGRHRSVAFRRRLNDLGSRAAVMEALELVLAE
jgi:tRNA-dihydrouridine synthase B